MSPPLPVFHVFKVYLLYTVYHSYICEVIDLQRTLYVADLQRRNLELLKQSCFLISSLCYLTLAAYSGTVTYRLPILTPLENERKKVKISDCLSYM